MHKFLKPKLFCPGVSIKIANKHICQLIKYRHENILIYKPFIPNQFLYSWTTDSLSYLYGLSTPWLRLTKKYISSISQRLQSHKIQAKSAQANSSITHRHENKNKNRHTSFTFKAISQHLHLSLSRGNDITY